MHALPKALVKVWGSNKTGVALFTSFMLGITTISAPIAVRCVAIGGIVLVAMAVIFGNAIEDAAQKLGSPTPKKK